MASQLSWLMINAGADLIRYPDVVLVLAGHGIEKKDQTKHSTHGTQLSGIHSWKCQLKRAELWFHFSPYEKVLRKTEAFKIFPLQQYQN